MSLENKVREAIAELNKIVLQLKRRSETLDAAEARIDFLDRELKKREASVKQREDALSENQRMSDLKESAQEAQKNADESAAELTRQKDAFEKEKANWAKQYEADKQDIANQRVEISKDLAALEKDRAEYKQKVLKKLGIKVNVEV